MQFQAYRKVVQVHITDTNLQVPADPPAGFGELGHGARSVHIQHFADFVTENHLHVLSTYGRYASDPSSQATFIKDQANTVNDYILVSDEV